MSTLTDTKDAILKELLGTCKGIIPKKEEVPFWEEIAGELAVEKLRYDAATSPEEKEKVAGNLAVLHSTIVLRLGKKELQVRNSVAKIAMMVLKTAVTHFFPGVGLIGELAKLLTKDGEPIA
ncbi:MAG: hypothetical protein WCU88_08460 [Elusimicrobiota bacterium]|jgi:hypothetical protein